LSKTSPEHRVPSQRALWPWLQADGSNLLYAHSGMVTAQAMGAKIDLLKEFRPVAKFTAGPPLSGGSR
jgi:hypothetical protein